MRITEEKQKHPSPATVTKKTVEEDVGQWVKTPEVSTKDLQSEIDSLLDPEPTPPPVAPTFPTKPSPFAERSSTSKEEWKEVKKEFGFLPPGTSPAIPPRIPSPGSSTQKITPPQLASSKSTSVVSAMASMIDSATTADQLLKDLLGMLVGPGLFQKSALIVVAKDKKKALVVAARGPNIGNGQTVVIDDPLSPLAECFSKVQSFGNRESKVSPFGSKAFALAPVEAHHETPVALYADCGNDGSVPFEARRIFRTVVEILNQKLPHLPGSIPVEI